MEELGGVAPMSNAGRGDAPGSSRNEDPAMIHFGKASFPSRTPLFLTVFLILSL